eukprot:gnl/Chilomastix_cuspidata/2101.p1 GENE.gnl/Chilomastix_cuspidata/2101~~gnl/Chilomastix_cuspidata/2101.p1  ORF type:complete len:216 (+),score=100.79 gnl/Chilomastix_cuspidata/2101:160-807(+)
MPPTPKASNAQRRALLEEYKKSMARLQNLTKRMIENEEKLVRNNALLEAVSKPSDVKYHTMLNTELTKRKKMQRLNYNLLAQRVADLEEAHGFGEADLLDCSEPEEPAPRAPDALDGLAELAELDGLDAPEPLPEMPEMPALPAESVDAALRELGVPGVTRDELEAALNRRHMLSPTLTAAQLEVDERVVADLLEPPPPPLGALPVYMNTAAALQ